MPFSWVRLSARCWIYSDPLIPFLTRPVIGPWTVQNQVSGQDNRCDEVVGGGAWTAAGYRFSVSADLTTPDTFSSLFVFSFAFSLMDRGRSSPDAPFVNRGLLRLVASRNPFLRSDWNCNAENLGGRAERGRRLEGREAVDAIFSRSRRH